MPSQNSEPSKLESAFDSQPSLSGHIWKQRGPWLVCVTCPREHAVGIQSFGAEPTDIFRGLADDGKPIFG